MKFDKKSDPDHVSFGKLLAWQTRNISAGCVTIIMGYLMLYCTNALKMSPALVGGLLMASKIFDGVTDLAAGYIVDNTNTRFGKARPYEFCIIGLWICTYALFAVPETWGTIGKAIWVFIMYTLVFSVFQTLLSAAETPYVIRAFGTTEAVTKVSAYGGIIITLGCMIVSMTFPVLVDRTGTSTAGWRKILLMYAVPLMALGLLRFFIVKEDRADLVTKNAGHEEKVSIREILHLLRSNKYIWFCAIAIMIPKMLGAMNVGTYYFSVVVGNLSSYSVISLTSLVLLVVMFVFPILMRRYSGMQLVGGCAAVGIVGYLVNYLAGGNMGLLLLGAFLAGISTLPGSYMKSPIIMQLADYNSRHGMKRMEASLSSVLNFLEKIGNSFGAFLIGALLSAANYDGNLAMQPDSAVQMIRCAYGLIPAGCLILVLVFVWAYRPLDREMALARTENPSAMEE